MFDVFGKGAAHIKIFAVWDCSRTVQQLEASSQTKFLITEEMLLFMGAENHSSMAPTVSVYACEMGLTLARDDFATFLT